MSAEVLEFESTTEVYEEPVEIAREPAEPACEGELGALALCAACPLVRLLGDCPKGIRQRVAELLVTPTEPEPLVDSDLFLVDSFTGASIGETPGIVEPYAAIVGAQEQYLVEPIAEVDSRADFPETVQPVRDEGVSGRQLGVESLPAERSPLFTFELPKEAITSVKLRSYRELLFDEDVSVVVAESFRAEAPTAPESAATPKPEAIPTNHTPAVIPKTGSEVVITPLIEKPASEPTVSKPKVKSPVSVPMPIIKATPPQSVLATTSNLETVVTLPREEVLVESTPGETQPKIVTSTNEEAPVAELAVEPVCHQAPQLPIADSSPKVIPAIEAPATAPHFEPIEPLQEPSDLIVESALPEVHLEEVEALAEGNATEPELAMSRVVSEEAHIQTGPEYTNAHLATEYDTPTTHSVGTLTVALPTPERLPPAPTGTYSLRALRSLRGVLGAFALHKVMLVAAQA